MNGRHESGGVATDRSQEGPGLSASWRRGVGLIVRTSPVLAGAVALTSLLGALAPVATIWFTAAATQGVTDAIHGVTTPREAFIPVAGIGVVMILTHLVSMLSGFVGSLMQLRLANHVTLEVIDQALTLEMADFEDPEVYDALQRAQREASMRPYQAFADLIATLTSAVTLVSVATAVLVWNPLAGVLLLISPLPVVISDVYFGRLGYRIEYGRAESRRRLQYWQYLLTHDRAVKEIRLFDLGQVFRGRYAATLEDFYEVDRGVQTRQASWSGLLGLIGVIAAGGALFLAAEGAIRTSDIGSFAGIAAAVGALRSATTSTFSGMAGLFEHALFLTNLFAFLDRPARAVHGGCRPFPRRLEHGVEFRDVSFTYPGTKDRVLDRVSFFLPAQSTTAIVGRNGAGKSTVIKLLARIYDPDEGVILVDGHPLEEYDVQSTRAAMGMIFQDFIQYEATLRENIGFGRVGLVDDDPALAAAAGYAGIDGLVTSLPKGLGTQLGRWFEDGHQLSGGQWQKLALARAFLRDGAITVLDEPTASIDAAAEADIFDKMMAVSRRTTTILVAHRFSTVRRADQILVLEGGRVTEQGTHHDLMELGRTYHHLFQLQASGYVDGL